MINSSHEFKLTTQQRPLIKGDAGLIKQLLRILTDNSIKYSEPGSTITVQLLSRISSGGNAENGRDSGTGAVIGNAAGGSTSRGFAMLSVLDEGIGIPGDVLPHIFDRFARADESRARNTGGAGLGLSIAKWITERHGGHLAVVSRPGAGTKVMAIFPL